MYGCIEVWAVGHVFLTALTMMPKLTRGMSKDARPMTRFIQYPFDKTKMAEVTEWFDKSGIAKTVRSKPGVKDLEVSFCPGQGWLAARYIFHDLEDMKTFLGSMETDPDLVKVKNQVLAAPHYDKSRTPHEFKGFFQPKL